MPKAHIDRGPSYPVGILPAVEAEPVEEPPSPPPANANKGAWVTYAAALGVDTSGMSKAQIRAAV